MLIAAFAFDYDGTLAHDGRVADATTTALQRLKATGVKVLLVTGRELPDLQRTYPDHEVFDVIVAENGALLYWPARREQKLLATPPPAELVRALRAARIEPLSIGRAIIATWKPNESVLRDAIRESGLEWQIVVNKSAVMALPSGVDKASGLAAALEALQISALNVCGVGDAENDHALLAPCGYRAAVANAVETLKREADIVTRGSNGAGSVELVERFLSDPAHILSAQVRRHDLPVARLEDASEQLLAIAPDTLTLIAGGSAGGASRLASWLMERIIARGAQLCVVDPEGDYERCANTTQLGDAQRPPSAPETLQLLQGPRNNVVLNLRALAMAARPQFFAQLGAAWTGLRASTGRPHWIIVDEAHHVLPATAQAAMLPVPPLLAGTLLVSSEPKRLSRPWLAATRYLITVGPTAVEMLRALCGALQLPSPPIAGPTPATGQALFWDRSSTTPARMFPLEAPSHEHQRRTGGPGGN